MSEHRTRRPRVLAVPSTFHLLMRLLTTRGTVGPWANHVFHVEVGHPRRRLRPRPGAPPPASPEPLTTVHVYGVVSAEGIVDALIPADWETALLQVGDALPDGAPHRGPTLAGRFGTPRLTIPLQKMPALPNPPPPPSPGVLDVQAFADSFLRAGYFWPETSQRLINLGYLDGASDLSTIPQCDQALAHAIRAYVFRQLHRSDPVRGDLFERLRPILASDDTENAVFGLDFFQSALLDHLRAVHDAPDQVP